MRLSIIRPGLLVSLNTRIRGGVSYTREDVESAHRTEAGTLREAWNTTKEVSDPDEHARAVVARGAARSAVVRLCSASDFGLLCPQEREAELAQAIEKARAIADEFNQGASYSRVEVYVIAGRVAATDEEAARAISAEVRGLLDSMSRAIQAADPERIREAANKARALGQMLTPEAGAKVERAIDQARKAAREIVARVERDGYEAAAVVRRLKVDAIEAARFAFLDLDTQAPAAQEATPTTAPALDLDPEPIEAQEPAQEAEPQASDEPEPAQEPTRRAESLSLPFELEV